MSGGQGKYTVYAPPANAKNTLMAKLYKDAPNASLVGKEIESREAVVENARQFMTPAHQQGDFGFFPQGVDLDFSGKSASIQAPDTAEGKDVTWKKAGDPANSYVPDVSSPGPGKTEGTDKDTDPKLEVKDIKPNYVAGAPGTGTKSPTVATVKLANNNTLGVPEKLGDSGANS